MSTHFDPPQHSPETGSPAESGSGRSRGGRATRLVLLALLTTSTLTACTHGATSSTTTASGDSSTSSGMTCVGETDECVDSNGNLLADGGGTTSDTTNSTDNSASVQVPDLTDLDPDSARAQLEQVGLRLLNGNNGNLGLVSSQVPAAGTTVSEGTSVTISLRRVLGQQPRYGSNGNGGSTYTNGNGGSTYTNGDGGSTYTNGDGGSTYTNGGG